MGLSHPDKILFPTLNISKSDLANYFLTVAGRMLPYIHDRPVTLVRCPKSDTEECFYQKHWMEIFGKDILPISIKEKAGTAQYMLIQNEAGLITAAQFATLEIHPWLSRKDKITKPDQMIFDLDPSPTVLWPDLLEAAMAVKALLNSFDLTCFIKLTGGKGLHIATPIKRVYEFDKIKSIAMTFAKNLVKKFPNLFTLNLSKEKRRGKIFIDYLRNTYGATAVAPFSPRANPEATIAVPISWEKLSYMNRLEKYSILTISDYLQEFKEDPWKGFFKVNVSKKLV